MNFQQILNMLDDYPNNTHDQETAIAVQQEEIPFSTEFVTLSRQDVIQSKADANRYKSLHQRALLKIKALEEALALEKGKVRDLTHRLYGKKTEKSTTTTDAIPPADDFVGPPQPKPKRGARKGRENRSRHDYSHLPSKEEIISIPEDQLCCPECGEAYQAFPKTEDSKIIEIHIKAHVRQIKREQAKASCQCPNRPGLIIAPKAPRVYPKAQYGVSVWTLIVLDKYQSYTPSNRLYQRLDDQGVPVSAGTITNGLQKIRPLFTPIQAAMKKQQAEETLFHNDETTWKVFETVEGKIGYKWYLWVTRSASVISFIAATGRSTSVIEDCFEDHQKDQIILVCDRYAAYKKFARENEEMIVILAFCWAHVRRDFLDAARSNPDNEDWMFRWVTDIGELYHLNQQRLEHWDKGKPLSKQSELFNQTHQNLCHAIDRFEQQIKTAKKSEAPLKGEPKTDRFKVVDSLSNHWKGLIVFVDNPHVPMDNNLAEQALRMPVAGRRSFYGSGAIWSAELATIMMGWIKTLQMWGINPYTWIYTYLQACAENNATPPEDLASFLPWEMNKERMEYFCNPDFDLMG